jgi:hypothetical protein
VKAAAGRAGVHVVKIAEILQKMHDSLGPLGTRYPDDIVRIVQLYYDSGVGRRRGNSE